MYVCSLRYLPSNAHAPRLWPAPLYNIFLRYLLNTTIFGKKKLLSINCGFLFSLQTLSETFFILRRTERDMIKECLVIFTYSTVILVQFQLDLNFLEFFENTQIPNFMKICPVRVELFHADGMMDRQTRRS